MDGNILILDYSDFEREKIKYILSKMGEFNIMEMASAGDYYSAMGSLKAISLIFMDIAFPYEDEGFEVLSDLKRTTGSHVPVIIISKSQNLQYRDRAAKLGVNDYIVKPYNAVRLEQSIRSLVRLEKRFIYKTEGIKDIVMPFDEYMHKQLSICEAVERPLTIIVITILETYCADEADETVIRRKKDVACITAVNTIEKMLSPYDMVFQNGDREILVILPFTDSAYGKLCNDKVRENIDKELSKEKVSFNDYFYSIYVTYPDEGRSFQDLMKKAFEKIADKDMQDKLLIPDSKEYVRKRYNQFTRWF